MEGISTLSVVGLVNLIFSAANLILALSLVIYILTQNLWSSVARSFAALLAFVSVVYGTDIILSRGLGETAAVFWLKFQWLGIAMVPAAYLHFSDALLRTTNASSRIRRAMVAASYVVGSLFVVAAFETDQIVREAVQYEPWAPQLVAGPAFWLFAIYFFLASAWGFANTLWARSRALTATSRRRLSYLVASFAAPGLAVYPYLIFTALPSLFSPILLLTLLLLGNFGVGAMMVVMAYSVVFQGALSPDRVVKRSFITYLLRGPTLAVFVLAIILVVPRVESILGAPRETMLIFAVVGGILFYEVFLRLLRPLINFFAYRKDRDEYALVRSLEERLFTTTDLQELMENLLTAVADLQRVRRGAVVSLAAGNKLQPESIIGPRDAMQAWLNARTISELVALEGTAVPADEIEAWPEVEGFRLLPLRADDSETMLGFLAVEPSAEAQPPTEREQLLMRQYAAQAEIALRDRRLQQTIFSLFQQLTPQMETLQRWRSTAPYPNAMPDTISSALALSPVHDENFTQMVRDALGHYWGGPRLTESPLLALQVVRDKLAEHDNNPARALRAVLGEALEALKPEGEREMTTQEWLLYNILDLKYVQGRRAREVAMSLAMSESDLYRKQRAAIDELARTLGKMEEEVQQSHQSGPLANSELAAAQRSP